MKSCEIRVIAPGCRDWTVLAENLRRLGHAVTDAKNHAAPQGENEIVVVDARGSSAAEWAEIEDDLAALPGPVVVITDEPRDAAAHASRLGRWVFTSGDSDMGFGLAIKLCALMREDERSQVAAA
jgi:hypothetical protein